MSVLDPTCPTGCSDFLPVVDFDACAPKVSFGEIKRIYVASLDAEVFADWTSAGEWTTRIDNTDVADIDKVRELTVSADMPAGAADTIEISDKRKVMTPSTFTINLDIDDNSDDNYEFMRWTECNQTVRMWYATEDFLYGGEGGVTATISLKEVIQRGTKSIIKLVGTATWENKYSPERCANPLS